MAVFDRSVGDIGSRFLGGAVLSSTSVSVASSLTANEWWWRRRICTRRESVTTDHGPVGRTTDRRPELPVLLRLLEFRKGSNQIDGRARWWSHDTGTAGASRIERWNR
jgi:hypothetical protein